MARRDGTGPMGQGPLTGRGMGYCAGEAVGRPYGRGVGYGRSAGFGRGVGYGRGAGFPRGMRGRGFACRPIYGGYPIEEQVNTMSEKEWLNEEKSLLEDRLNLIKEELDNLNDE